MRIVESEEPVLIGFVKIEKEPEIESVFDLHRKESKRTGMDLLEETFEQIKDKIKVVAADV
jgi:predicted site-specific integrase-resolvase